MPQLFDLSDIEMTIDVLQNLAEVVSTEQERRKIGDYTIASESPLSIVALVNLRKHAGRALPLNTIMDMLVWVQTSMNKE